MLMCFTILKSYFLKLLRGNIATPHNNKMTNLTRTKCLRNYCDLQISGDGQK